MRSGYWWMVTFVDAQLPLYVLRDPKVIIFMTYKIWRKALYHVLYPEVFALDHSTSFGNLTFFMKKSIQRTYRFFLLNHTILNHPLILLALHQENGRKSSQKKEAA